MPRLLDQISLEEKERLKKQGFREIETSDTEVNYVRKAAEGFEYVVFTSTPIKGEALPKPLRRAHALGTEISKREGTTKPDLADYEKFKKLYEKS